VVNLANVPLRERAAGSMKQGRTRGSRLPLGAEIEILSRAGKNGKRSLILTEELETPENGHRLSRPPADTLEGNDQIRFETSTGLHVATGYTRVVVGGRGPYVEFLPGHLIWDNLDIPDEEKYRLEHPWKDKVFYVEWRTKDQSNVKVYDQKRTVGLCGLQGGAFLHLSVLICLLRESR